MPKQSTVTRAKRDRLEGKSASTQAGEFVREEIHDIRKGKHGARSPQQAIAIGLSKARRAGVRLKPPEPGKAPERTRRQATRDYARGQGETKPRRASAQRAASSERALKREPRDTASTQALATHARVAASRRSGQNRSAAAQKAAQTKGPAKRVAAARRAARTRAAHSYAEVS
jgi:hypothetical protein